MKKPAHQCRFFLLIVNPNLVRARNPVLVAASRPRFANELPDVDVMAVARTKIDLFRLGELTSRQPRGSKVVANAVMRSYGCPSLHHRQGRGPGQSRQSAQWRSLQIWHEKISSGSTSRRHRLRGHLAIIKPPLGAPQFSLVWCFKNH